MKGKRTIVWGGILVVSAILACLLVRPLLFGNTLAYWQKQAAGVHTGMLRSDVEKILPPQTFDGVLWRLEEWRMFHLPSLPPLRKALRFALSSSNLETQVAYEVSDGVCIFLRYDLAGRLPRSGVQNPGDHVLSGPFVLEVPPGVDFNEWAKEQRYKCFGY
ncbi:hypothetical protein [Prosthecobacter sp.]|uniref:hypothetical protein n=1 Tax=Prosthecobacter sp. TaxID=1965333 RepID=UPI0037834BD4